MAAALIRATPPGCVTAVIGPPGSGVSTTLAATCNAAVTEGLPSAMACWERPPNGWGDDGIDSAVVCPEIIGWAVEDLSSSDLLTGLIEGSLVAVDYAQLVGADARSSFSGLKALAENRLWRVVVGVMATRSFDCDSLLRQAHAYLSLYPLPADDFG